MTVSKQPYIPNISNAATIYCIVYTVGRFSLTLVQPMFLKIHPKGNERKFSILSTVYKFITIISAVRLHERKKTFCKHEFLSRKSCC